MYTVELIPASPVEEFENMTTVNLQPVDPKKIPTDWKPSLPKQTPARGPWKDQTQEHDPLFEKKQEVLSILRNQTHTVYGLFDAARNDRIIELFREFGLPANLPDDRRAPPPQDDPTKCEYESLYILGMKSQLANAGPWIVRLPKDSVLLEKLVLEGWGMAWGWYFSSKSTLLALRRHFRHYILVTTIDGPVLFRFYDPRVFNNTIDANDDLSLIPISEFLAPCNSWHIEDIQAST